MIEQQLFNGVDISASRLADIDPSYFSAQGPGQTRD
jgi:hypothetical protein